MKRSLILLFGVVSYLLFLAAFLYLIGFLESMVVVKAINDGAVTDKSQAVLIDVLLLGLFVLQHTVMARLAFKRWWTGVVSPSLERSIYVLLTNLVLFLIFWQWRPLPEAVWSVEAGALRNLIVGLSFVGWGIGLVATFLIDHFDLFGLRHVWFAFKGKEYEPVVFKEHVFYQWCRHPLMFGVLIGFWATPNMTQGHLLFVGVWTVYILFGIQIEERTLLAIHGEHYQRYRERVSMLIPWPPKKTGAS